MCHFLCFGHVSYIIWAYLLLKTFTLQNIVFLNMMQFVFELNMRIGLFDIK